MDKEVTDVVTEQCDRSIAAELAAEVFYDSAENWKHFNADTRERWCRVVDAARLATIPNQHKEQTGDGKLLPCPMCGSATGPILSKTQDSWWYVDCLDCNARGGDRPNTEGALAAWNTRAVPAITTQEPHDG